MKFVVRKPIVTEKSSIQAELGFYSFEVEREATKTDIKTAVENYFEVKVDSIKTLICRGRSKRTAGGQVKPRYWKKALVKLKDGQKIKMFEGGN